MNAISCKIWRASDLFHLNDIAPTFLNVSVLCIIVGTCYIFCHHVPEFRNVVIAAGARKSVCINHELGIK